MVMGFGRRVAECRVGTGWDEGGVGLVRKSYERSFHLY